MYGYDEDFDDFDDYGDSENASDSEKSDLPIIVTQRKELVEQNHTPILEPGSISVRDVQQHARNGDTAWVGNFLNGLTPAGDGSRPGVDLDTGGGWTMLMHAASAGRVAVVELLLKHGADPNHRNADGCSPVLVTAASSHCDDEEAAECVRRLIDAGAGVDEEMPPPDTLGRPNPGVALDTQWSPLHAAAKANRSAVIAVLVEAGAVVDSRDRFDWTPLMVAASEGSLAAVNSLLRLGADPRLRVRPRRGGDPGAADASPAVLAHLAGHSQLSDALRVLSGETAGDDRLYWVLRKLREVNEAEEVREETAEEVAAGERADELATFLHGVGLFELLPRMKAQGVTLSLLMKTSDAQLREIGVERLGDRSKILNTVHEMHKVAWTEDKPQHLEFGKPLKLRDLVSVAGHTSRHVEFLDASVSFINSHLVSYRDFYVGALESRPNAPAMLQSVDGICEEGLQSCRQLFHNLHLLRRHAAEVRGAASICEIPDLVPPAVRRQSRRRKMPALLLPILGAVLIFAALRGRPLLSRLTSRLSALPSQ